MQEEKQEELLKETTEQEEVTEKVESEEVSVEQKNYTQDDTVSILNKKISKLHKILVGTVVLALIFLFSSVNFSSENKNLKEKTQKLEEINEKIKIEVNESEKKLSALYTEFNEYKEKMKPYEELQQADLEKKKAEIQAEREKKEAEYKAKKEAEEKAKQEEEQKGYETGITYEDLARSPEEYKGKKVTFSGTIIQVIRGESFDQYRVKVNDDYKKVILVEYKPKSGDKKFLEEDKVIIRGVSVGEISYKSTMGGKISIPGMVADFMELK